MTSTLSAHELQLFNNNDEQIFNKVYSLYSRRLFFYSYEITNDIMEAEDIAIKTLTKLWESKKNFQSKDELERYIFTVARNTSCTFLRDKKRKSEALNKWLFLSNDADYDGFGSYDKKETLLIVDEMIGGMSGRNADVLRLYYHENLKRKDIAKRLKMKVGNVSTQLNYGIKKIIRFFKGE